MFWKPGPVFIKNQDTSSLPPKYLDILSPFINLVSDRWKKYSNALMDPWGEVNEFNIIVNIVPVDISASVGAVESTDTALTKFGFHVQCGAVILRSIF